MQDSLEYPHFINKVNSIGKHGKNMPRLIVNIQTLIDKRPFSPLLWHVPNQKFSFSVAYSGTKYVFNNKRLP
jgi:hypothetical protein